MTPLEFLLKVLNLRPEDLKKLENRLRVHKAAYLLHYLGVEPFSRDDFPIYIRGPFSPELDRAIRCYMKDKGVEEEEE